MELGKRLDIPRGFIPPNGRIISERWFSGVSQWWLDKYPVTSGVVLFWKKYDIMNFVDNVFKSRVEVPIVW